MIAFLRRNATNQYLSKQRQMLWNIELIETMKLYYSRILVICYVEMKSEMIVPVRHWVKTKPLRVAHKDWHSTSRAEPIENIISISRADIKSLSLRVEFLETSSLRAEPHIRSSSRFEYISLGAEPTRKHLSRTQLTLQVELIVKLASFRAMYYILVSHVDINSIERLTSWW